MEGHCGWCGCVLLMNNTGLDYCPACSKERDESDEDQDYEVIEEQGEYI